MATRSGPDGEPLFNTPTFLGPTTKAVEGVQYLGAGTYDFYCTIHPEMTGRLTVTSPGEGKGTVAEMWLPAGAH